MSERDPDHVRHNWRTIEASVEDGVLVEWQSCPCGMNKRTRYVGDDFNTLYWYDVVA